MTKKTPGRHDYTVGYGRPPKSTQFKKGTSGNPAGKPKGSRSFASYLNEALSKKVTLTENGKSRDVPGLLGIAHRLRNDSLRGENAALRTLLAELGRNGNAPDSDINLGELLKEDAAILAQARRDGLLPELKADEAPELEDDQKGGDDEEGGDGRPV